MLTYKEINRKIGIRAVGDFLKPRVMESVDFSFPKSSTCFFLGNTRDAIFPESSDRLFKKSLASRPRVFVVDNYSIKTIGKFTRNSIKTGHFITNAKKTDPLLEFALSRLKLELTSANKLIIYNFGILSALYKYSDKRNSEYERYWNATNTMVRFTHRPEKLTDRMKYIVIDIPDVLVDTSEYRRNLSRSNYKITETFKDHRGMHIMELYRLLQDTNAEKSPFSSLLTNVYDDTVFIFKHNTKITTCNVKSFLSLNSSIDIKDREFNGFDGVRAGKVFLKYILEIQKNSALHLKDMIIADPEHHTEITVKDSDINTESQEREKLHQKIEVDRESIVKEETITAKEIMSKKSNRYDDTTNVIAVKLEQGIIKESTSKKQLEILKKQKDDKLFEAIEVKQEDLVVNKDTTTISDTLSVIDKSQLEDTLKPLSEKYITEIKAKDDLRVIYGIQKAGFVVSNHEIVEEASILGDIEIHHIKVIPPGGREVTLKIRLPKVNKDGVFKMSGQSYIMEKQKSDAPIRKISANEVALTSFYGKLFIRKNVYSKDDFGLQLVKSLQKRNAIQDDPIAMVVLGKIITNDTKLPTVYTAIGANARSFKYKNDFFSFDYEFRESLLKGKKKLKDVEPKNMVLVGVSGGKPLLMDLNNKLYKKDDKELKDLGYFTEYIETDIRTLPITFSMIRIVGKNVPTVLLHIYYKGLNNVIKSLGAKYKKFDTKRKATVEDNEYMVQFRDAVYMFDRNDVGSAMILGGLGYVSKIIKGIDVGLLDTKDGIIDIFVGMGFNRRFIKELDSVNNLFIDPITEDILVNMKEPTNFIGLLYRASELLEDDFSKHTNDVSEMLFRGYDRMPGMMYHTLTRAIRDYESKHGTIQTKLTVNPYGVWSMIGEDPTVMLEDSLNPILALKQKENVTFTGFGGRGSDTLNRATREYNESEVGIVSEATTDSSQVGVTVYTSAAPKLGNLRGVVDKESQTLDKIAHHNIFSTSLMLALFGLKDD